MATSITLSNMSASFAKNSSHLGKQDPYLELDFAGKAYLTTMVKGGGVQVAWSQPVLLDGDFGPGGGMLKVVAKAHKALMKDKVLGEGKVDLAAAAQSTGLTTVPLTSPLKGGHAGQVYFNVAFGTRTGGQALSGHQGSGNVVEDVGGVGRNVDGSSSPSRSRGGALAAGGGAASPGAGASAGTMSNERHHEQPGLNNGVGTGRAEGNQVVPQQGAMQQGHMKQGGMQQGNMQQGNMQQSGMQQGGMQQGGVQQGQPGALQVGNAGAMQQGGFNRPREEHEARHHSVHDHNESESSEIHRIG